MQPMPAFSCICFCDEIYTNRAVVHSHIWVRHLVHSHHFHVAAAQRHKVRLPKPKSQSVINTSAATPILPLPSAVDTPQKRCIVSKTPGSKPPAVFCSNCQKRFDWCWAEHVAGHKGSWLWYITKWENHFKDGSCVKEEKDESGDEDVRRHIFPHLHFLTLSVYCGAE